MCFWIIRADASWAACSDRNVVKSESLVLVSSEPIANRLSSTWDEVRGRALGGLGCGLLKLHGRGRAGVAAGHGLRRANAHRVRSSRRLCVSRVRKRNVGLFGPAFREISQCWCASKAASNCHTFLAGGLWAAHTHR